MTTVNYGRVIMVKKRLRSGEPCRKCAQAEDMLRRRGVWEHIHEVVWADEGDPDSPGWDLARRHGVENAPFFLVRTGEEERVYTSALKLVKEVFQQPRPAPREDAPSLDLERARQELAEASAAEVVSWALEHFGEACAIAFSGAEDVVLLELAARTERPFSVFCLDTGRLPAETYEHIEAVRQHYGIAIDLVLPDPEPVRELVSRKGLFSFYRDGHAECCNLRKVQPLARVLTGYRAWMTGQRRDQNASTRGELAPLEIDPQFRGKEGKLLKFNPLAAWTSDEVWREIHARKLPYNPLFDRGFRSIGCAPCTRPVAPGQPDRAGRWWWEAEDEKECGLHVTR
jgi:phosphoadenosine phosphosulfate reductase